MSRSGDREDGTVGVGCDRVADLRDECGIDDPVAVEHEERAVDDLLGLQDRMGGPELCLLNDVLDVDVPVVAVAEVVPDSFLSVAHDEDDAIDTGTRECRDDVVKYRSVRDRNHGFRSSVR